ncbi:MAG: hypothetical protein L0Z46_07115 [Nitrospiraceae bacterium]|nr:hypothetical protein [Nitrospiraceae bacterium]
MSRQRNRPARGLTLSVIRLHYAIFWMSDGMWKRNFMFRSAEAIPLKESENELFHDTDPAMDSTGLNLEKFLSVWIQGDGEDEKPTAFTNMYVRTATLDFQKRVGFLQPLQGRSHQIKQVLTPGQKQFLQQWLATEAPQAWEATDDQFKMLFELE